jgi:adenine-specific DNA glycosylase
VRGTRDSNAVISRRAARSAKLSRNWPPAYIRATIAAARLSPNARAALIDNAATISSPTSPRRSEVTISTTSAASTGSVTATQIGADQAPRPASRAAKPAARPEATRPARSWRATVSVRWSIIKSCLPSPLARAMRKIKAAAASYGLDS